MVDFNKDLGEKVLVNEDSLKNIIEREVTKNKMQTHQGVFYKLYFFHDKLCQYSEDLFDCVAHFLTDK